jgi:hypothetical protein
VGLLGHYPFGGPYSASVGLAAPRRLLGLGEQVRTYFADNGAGRHKRERLYGVLREECQHTRRRVTPTTYSGRL